MKFLKAIDKHLVEYGESVILCYQAEQMFYAAIRKWLKKKFRKLKRKLFPSKPWR